MHVAQFLNPLFPTPNVKIIKAMLPELRQLLADEACRRQ
jgi:hypothetical protein